MTAKQRAAREKFKKVVAEASKLRKKNPKLTQAQAVKQAWAIEYAKEGKSKKVGKTHKDTKSHNVNIRVVSGVKKKKSATKKAKKIVGDFLNRDTRIKDARGYRKLAKPDYVLTRSKNGKFANFSKVGASTPSQYVSLSGYKYGKEIVVAGVGKLSTLKSLVPDVKLRVTRGKKAISDQITSPEVASEIFKRFIGKNKIETQELFAVAYCNQANKVLGVYVHSIGSINAVNVDVRLVLAGALQMGAVSMILCHNHPSGNLKPSEADINMTKQLMKASEIHNIKLLDHIIITKDGYYSFNEKGIM